MKAGARGESSIRLAHPGSFARTFWSRPITPYDFHVQHDWAKLQNTPQLWSASLTCVGRLWRSRHNTIDAILIQWHVNELRGILKLLPWLNENIPHYSLPSTLSKITAYYIIMLQVLDKIKQCRKQYSMLLGLWLCFQIVCGDTEIFPN